MRTDVAPAPVETVTPIKPSEALRLGRLTRPIHTPGKKLSGSAGACALGAIAIGAGYDGDDDNAWEFLFTYLDRFDVETRDIWRRFDTTECAGRDGDAAVLAYLRRRGL